MSERFAQHLRPMPFAALGSYATAIEPSRIEGPILGHFFEDDPYGRHTAPGEDFIHELFMFVKSQLGDLEKLVIRDDAGAKRRQVFAYSDGSVYLLEFDTPEFDSNVLTNRPFEGFNRETAVVIVGEIWESGNRGGADVVGPDYDEDRAGWLQYRAPTEWTRDLRAEMREKQRWLREASPKGTAKAAFAVADLRSGWQRLAESGLVIDGEPATPEDFEQFKEATGFSLPRELKELMKLSNGADLAGNSQLRLLSVEEIADRWSSWNSIYDTWTLEELTEHRDTTDERVVNAYVIPGWIPIIDDDGDMVGFDREPGPGGSRGQIISYGRDREATTVVASDLVAFLRKIEGSVR